MSADIDAAMWQIIFDSFDLDGAGSSAAGSDDVSDYEKGLLEAAFDKTFHGTSENPPAKKCSACGPLPRWTTEHWAVGTGSGRLDAV